MAAPMLGMAIINAIVFGVQGNMMKYREHNLLNIALTGGIAGAAQSFVCSPMELIKLRLQVQTNPTDIFHWHATTGNGRLYHDPWDAFKKILKHGGIKELFKGLELTLLREIPAFSAYFCTYEYSSRLIINLRGNGMTFDDLSPLSLCLAGGMSGIAAWVITYPVDVVKSRVQVDGMYDTVYNSIWDCCIKSSQEPEGYRVFLKGLFSTVVRGFVVNAATLPTVSLILRYWRQQ